MKCMKERPGKALDGRGTGTGEENSHACVLWTGRSIGVCWRMQKRLLESEEYGMQEEVWRSTGG